MKSAPFHGLRLSDPGVRGLIDWLVAEPGEARLAGYLNAHTFNLCTDHGSELAPLLAKFDLIYPDGMAVVWAARRGGFTVSERVSAADFLLSFCRAAVERGRSLALVGGAGDLAANCAAALTGQVPGLEIVHAAPGYLAFPGAEFDVLVADLRRTAPAIVLLGMGSPRQEALALALRDAGIRATIWCVGALFEYYTPGVRSHAPEWMRRGGLEWLYRLAQEPRRLAKRYLIGNFVFVWRVLRRVTADTARDQSPRRRA